MTLRQYIDIMDLFVGVDLKPDMTATDIYNISPATVTGMVSILTGEPVDKLDKLPVNQLIGQFASLQQTLDFAEPRPVPFIHIGSSVYTAPEPLMIGMSGEPVPYGLMDFGSTLEVLQLIDNAKYKHRALPMLIAHIYECDKDKPIHEKAKELEGMNAGESHFIAFFLTCLKLGSLSDTLSLSVASIEHRNT
jgi:hypothetical protein